MKFTKQNKIDIRLTIIFCLGLLAIAYFFREKSFQNIEEKNQNDFEESLIKTT